MMAEDVCDVRHGALNRWCKAVEIRIGKLENRFFWITSLLIANLLVAILHLLLRIAG